MAQKSLALQEFAWVQSGRGKEKENRASDDHNAEAVISTRSTPRSPSQELDGYSKLFLGDPWNPLR
jgi:hypothetical protein